MSYGLTNRATVSCSRRTMVGSGDGVLRSFGSMDGVCEPLVVVGLMQPDVVLYRR